MGNIFIPFKNPHSVIFTFLMVSSLAAITEDFIQESYLIHIVVGISVLNISFDISDDGTSVEEKI